MNETSIKELLQSLIPINSNLTQGIVTGTTPLTISIINNPKMVLSGSNLILGEHLTDRIVEIEKENKEKLKITVKDGLKANEKVWLLSFFNGKYYYCIDRVVIN